MISGSVVRLLILCGAILFTVHLCLRQINIHATSVLDSLPSKHGRFRANVDSCRSGSFSGRITGNRCHDSLQGVSGWERPADVKKVMGLIFYGRRQTVAILDCYLKRTKDADDLALLDKILASESAYTKWSVDLEKGGYASSYDGIQDGVMYVKMDDDVVFVEDTAIKSIVEMKAAHPEYYAVSANVVNQVSSEVGFGWLHRNMGAVKPYLPDSERPPISRVDDWRPSNLPSWDGPSDFSYKSWTPLNGQKHRWLPIRGRTERILDDTPISEAPPDGEYAWKSWQAAAQMHYSLLENIENGELWRYRFPMWDYQRKRMGIQFVAMMGDDINLAKPIGQDDELHFSVEMTTRLGRSKQSSFRHAIPRNSVYRLLRLPSLYWDASPCYQRGLTY
ncbi:hypothetical protein CDD83_3119 [Cordyceps sp. RAO-2017]|nr:hypothetical protein CDD83_3119 [Cordyceps sp. RAO-2017]